MSEADYMDDCDMINLADHHERERDRIAGPLYEVVDWRNEPVFNGSRAACYAYRNLHGGFVRGADQ